MEKEYSLDEVIKFGEFLGMTVREAVDKNPRLLFRMQNGTKFNLDDEAFEYLEKQMR